MLQFQAHHGTVNAVALTDNGEIMVSCGVDKQLCAWSVEDGALLFTASLGCVYTCLTLSGLIVLCGTDSGYLHAWDIAAHARLFVVQVHPGMEP
ncbi:hypothetical protein SARC_00561 [Sphaeroforma arctica JP610]|uniref:Uncharacterized protein n=1 Tax=Sphaeroforma arctica JP610 TaxID=667725 RepID=A0A0L0GEK1_9EUKA|nr:hypothetical protein SARC_00561 [Sphaeroforma arctica JP610]KNC87319.1 hypothetical protein SARC_00561 [Sphaeroforma arctica JP610]|eukprot:XP_014161221.1 hypothetical protein SARC_00561 [Sphaeroforma arctica JP610]